MSLVGSVSSKRSMKRSGMGCTSRFHQFTRLCLSEINIVGSAYQHVKLLELDFMMTEIKIKSTNMLGARHVLHIASCGELKAVACMLLLFPKKFSRDVEMLSVQCEGKTYTLVNSIFLFPKCSNDLCDRWC